MAIDDFVKILLSGASISFGAFLGILRSKIFASKTGTKLHNFFYGFSGLVFLLAVIGAINFWSDLFDKHNYFGISVVVAAIVCSVLLFYFSKRYLHFKDVFKTDELDPIVNDFTSSADKGEIKLFGGDLNFLGEHPGEIDKHQQYILLRAFGFKKISILCEAPVNNTQRIRYGKILSDIPGTELRFYNPETADLKVRGRIIKVDGANKLLMYNRVKSGVYKTIETDTGNSNGALYNNIWDLTWSLAMRPSQDEIDGYKQLYN